MSKTGVWRVVPLIPRWVSEDRRPTSPGRDPVKFGTVVIPLRACVMGTNDISRRLIAPFSLHATLPLFSHLHSSMSALFIKGNQKSSQEYSSSFPVKE